MTFQPGDIVKFKENALGILLEIENLSYLKTHFSTEIKEVNRGNTFVVIEDPGTGDHNCPNNKERTWLKVNGNEYWHTPALEFADPLVLLTIELRKEYENGK